MKRDTAVPLQQQFLTAAHNNTLQHTASNRTAKKGKNDAPNTRALEAIQGGEHP